MIKVSVLYPASEGSHFDIDYYCGTHMDLVRDRLGPALKSIGVDQGLAGATPGSKPPFAAIGHLLFASEADLAAFAPHAAELMADVPNFTDIQPVVLVSDVKM